MASDSRRRLWLWVLLGVLAGLGVGIAILFSTVVPVSSDILRHRIVASLSWRLDSDVTLGDLHVRVFPRLRAEGSDLAIRRHGREDVPPLISIKSFSVEADLLGLARKHVAHVQIVGLDIEIPPSRDDSEGKGQRAQGSTRKDSSLEGGVVIDTLDSSDARLVIIPRRKDKDPKVWAIHRLQMHDVGIDQAMPFEATLTNGVPPGEIDTTGSFGPWQRDDPGETPLNGTFTFAGADLRVFHGISGTLSSQGSFDGSLARIDVNGETDTPDFTIRVGNHPFPLHVKYHALVDGTNGDTRLERIDGWFLSSYLHAKGAVLDAPKGKRGRTVTLDVTMDRSRIEDIMTMAVKTPKPPMAGALKLTTTFVLPPGENDVSDRLRLDGRFAIDRARFTNIDVQGKIDELSHRGRGQKADRRTDGVVSNFQGRFTLADGRIALPDVTFAVPGARVELAGQYGLKLGTLDFKGRLLLDAKVSQTQTGIRSLLLKAVDPLFNRKGGGSAIPIRIGGTWNVPDFGLDVRRVFKRGDTP